MTSAASTCVETLTASVSSNQTPREDLVSPSSMGPPPPPPSPSTSTQDITVDQVEVLAVCAASRTTVNTLILVCVQVVSLSSDAAQPNPMASSYAPTPPLPPPRKVAAPAVPLQTTPSGSGVYKKIPAKFTVCRFLTLNLLFLLPSFWFAIH